MVMAGRSVHLTTLFPVQARASGGRRNFEAKKLIDDLKVSKFSICFANLKMYEEKLSR